MRWLVRGCVCARAGRGATRCPGAAAARRAEPGTAAWHALALPAAPPAARCPPQHTGGGRPGRAREGCVVPFQQKILKKNHCGARPIMSGAAAAAAGGPPADGSRPQTYTDADGTVMEWDPAKGAYFPKVSE